VLVALLIMLFGWPYGFAQVVSGSDLTELSIEDLMEQKVTSVSKTEQTFSDTAAATFVITQDDLRRSGGSNIPEALRMVPGVQVARIDSNKWAITARGFNGRFANKLLVLIDGRTVYTPSFSGVYWETQDLVLEDIERIEVIRGPGASVWGANAVNGIINIITKHAEDTQGGLVSLTAGDEERVIAGVRYGAPLGEQGSYRIYGKHFERDGLVDESGRDAGDDWDLTRGGFRVDWAPSASNVVMAQGDVYDGDIDQNFTVPSILSPTGGQRVLEGGDASGGSLLTRWEHLHSLASRVSVQFYYERFRRNDTFQNERRDTFDLDLQHELALTKRQEFIWGLGYRLSSDRITDAELVSVSPEERDLHLFSAFLQDRISLFDDHLELTVGTKLEYHTFSGWEYQPNVRTIWKPHRNHRLWASFSRATRTPSRGERDAEVRFSGIPQLQSIVVLEGNRDFEPERVLSYELGYRAWLKKDFYLDIAAFYNDYDDLRLPVFKGFTEPDTIALQLINGENAKTWGVELATDWRPLDWLRFHLAYTFLDTTFALKSGTEVSAGFFPLGDQRDPMNQVSLRSSFNLSPTVELDLWARYQDRIPDSTVINPASLPQVGDYAAFDVRLGWRPFRHLELSLVGRDLNDSGHLEFLQELAAFPTQVERSIYGQIKWEF
ncbi:MAG: TonB-dependent receptor plug domain-containing protein, partial [Gammaproteobacteria bacterium]